MQRWVEPGSCLKEANYLYRHMREKKDINRQCQHKYYNKSNDKCSQGAIGAHRSGPPYVGQDGKQAEIPG